MTTDDQLSRDLQSLRIERRPRAPAPEPVAFVEGGAAFPWARVAKLGAAIGVVALVVVGWRVVRERAAPQLFKPEVALGQVGAVSPVQASVEVIATGYVVPQVVAKVGTKVVGRVAKVAVREGGAVKAGEVLFELDPSDQRAQVAASSARVGAAAARVEAARAQLRESEIQLARQRELARVGAAPTATADDLAARVTTLREQLKAQEAEVLAARADVAQLSVGLGHATVRAPIDGVAVTKPVELGDVVSPAATLVELADFTSLLVEADVPEARLGKIAAGKPCEIVLDALEGQRFRGKVVAVGPRLNRSKATAQVKVRFDAPPAELRPEMAARVSFLSRPLDDGELRAVSRVVVPASAVVERDGAKVVWALEGDKVHAVPVALGAREGAEYTLTSGPAPGTKLVVSPPPELREGQAVKERAK